VTPRRSIYQHSLHMEKGHVGREVDLPFFLFVPRYLAVCASVWFICALLASAAVSADALKSEFRGLWIVRHDLTTPGKVIRAMGDAKRSGFNAVMVQVRGRGDALYRSRFVPRSETLAGTTSDFDPLALVIEEARLSGLQVHAWVNAFLTWHPTSRRPTSTEHLLLRHPEWFMVSSDGIDMGCPDLAEVDLVQRGVEGRYLSPGVPEVRAHLAAVVGELIRNYDLDGVHLDYVRFPNKHYDYNLVSRTGFVSRYRFDPLSMGSDLSVRGQVAKDSSLATRARIWEAWRAEQVTETVGLLRETVDAAKPWVRLSAAVKPDPAVAYRQYGQDWIGWVNGGLLDFVVPMFYVGSTDEVSQQVRLAAGHVKRGHLYAGVGAYNQSVNESLSQIESVRRIGVPGVVIYSYASLANRVGLAGFLRSGPFAEGTAVPPMPWKPERGRGEDKAR
jgi:uncharacterized lipoprotein YddW (UPF0748 family)